jgi:phosphoribosylamine-glycine ligase
MDRLRLLGFRVYSCGHRAEGPGVANADDFFLVDVLDPVAVAGLAKQLGVDFVYSVGSDMAMPTVAAVSEELGLPGFHDLETTELLHRKVRLRAFLNEHDLSPVEFRVLRSAADVSGFSSYPAIIKPSDSQAQRGISVVHDVDEARQAVGSALAQSRSGEALIEELLDGPEVSVHVFVVDGAIEFLLPSDRFVWDGPLTGIPIGHRIPAHFVESESHGQIIDLVTSVVDALQIGTGPLYFQLMLTRRGPRIIEIAPRLDGCHLWRLIEIHTGFNILDRCLELLAGDSWSTVPEWDDDADHVLRFHLSPPDRPFTHDDWDASAEGTVLYEEFQVEEGQLPRDTNGIIARVGFTILQIP